MTSPSPDAPARGQPDVEGPLVLIVDDNEKNRKLARDVLRSAGLRTLEAASGAEGMAIAARHLPDVILMDLRLPDMDGTNAVRQLAGDERTGQIPVVALTSVPLGEAGDWFRAAGFAGYVEKPFAVAEFAARIRSYCLGADA